VLIVYTVTWEKNIFADSRAGMVKLLHYFRYLLREPGFSLVLSVGMRNGIAAKVKLAKR
jgi:hypothetical protein